VKAWLFTILRHTHINGYRQSARQLRRNTMEKPLARSKDAQMYRKSLSALQEEA
jgi:DNA-directed RNA polymerase specialized sigma24 family protein